LLLYYVRKSHKGYDGGILALLLAIHHPKCVSKIATFGANTFPGNKAVFNEIDQMVVDTLKSIKNAHTRQLYNLLEPFSKVSSVDLYWKA